MANIYSVEQVNNYIKNMFDSDFLLNNINVSGEVSNCKYHSSGHIYFTLKDASGTLSAIMFAGSRRTGLDFKLEDGMKVVCTGNVSVFEAAGKYQIYVKQIKKEGSGELYKRFLMLKEKLNEMGLFDKMYKKPIPKNIKKLGIVTARTGAAVHDIVSVSRRRNPGIELVLFPAKVQGEGAAESVCLGIEMLDAMGVDTIIVGRGGGSIEDLWAFNEEMVVRTVFNCDTPIISAVGHETDFTIIDFVSDMRAPTPSAAAELAVDNVSESIRQLSDYKYNLDSMIDTKINNYRERLNNYLFAINKLSPNNILNNKRIILDDISDRLNLYINSIMERKRAEFKLLVARLNALSPLTKLESGYSYVESLDGKNISSVTEVSRGDKIKIYVKDGLINTTVTDVCDRENM